MVLPDAVLGAITRLEAAGFEAVAVGGCVRDHLMGFTPKDYDLATSALPEDVGRALAGERIVPTGLRHGTVTLVADGMPIEITTYRVDGEYLDHRRPEGVRFTRSLREDLNRRDFTINAIAFSPDRGLIDPMGGREDIRKKRVRAVGDPAQRFSEDALRILRALRFAARLGFTIEEDTGRALNDLRASLSLVARERVGAEMEGLVSGPGAATVIRAHRAVLEAAIPELEGTSDEAWTEALERLARAPSGAAARLAALLSPLGESAQRALGSLRLPAKETDRAMRLIGWMGKREFAPARALGALGAEDARALIRLRGADEGARRELEGLIESGACVTVGQLAVDGRDMMALGLSGPAVGEALNRLLDGVIGGLPNERTALLARAAGGGPER